MIFWFVVAANLIVTGPVWFMSRDLKRIRKMWDEAVQNNYRHLEEIRHLKVMLEQRDDEIRERKRRIRIAYEMLKTGTIDDDGKGGE